jgi:hypothetical protein
MGKILAGEMDAIPHLVRLSEQRLELVPGLEVTTQRELAISPMLLAIATMSTREAAEKLKELRKRRLSREARTPVMGEVIDAGSTVETDADAKRQD